ncbi:polysaccharide biosynthesis protein [Acuticoccus sediminis]|uniref:Polysaccharide biosynthesis protein n=1 Tax=Acuticoccus sediminis TaxID=2184697 RepID=A0A8B2NJ76_9HYPH|nr:oligosaccharide flippase family protein [Acuticoccus sediminis]RAH98336.1 polysaccharide biosynthesis protein [Acuticoccus sediminis]
MSLIRRGILASAADKYLSQAIAVATLAVMSRILTPREIGLYMLANTVILLSENLRMFGVGIFIVQEPRLERTTLRSAFTIYLILSLGVALCINLGAGLISAFFHESELAPLLSLASIAFLIAPFGNPILALLQRDLSFARLAVLNIAMAVVNAAVTIGLGWAGFGPVSYVWGFIAATATLTLGAVLCRPELWIFRPTLSDARRILSFGIISSTVTVLNMAYDLLPRLALGRILGIDAVGVYARSVTICQIPERVIVSALQPVVLPAMAAEVRAGGDLKASYLRGHALMSSIQWPTLVMLALLADPVVRILLGSQWGEAVPLVRLIAVATMALAPAFMTFPVLVSVGRIRSTLWATLISLPPSAAIVIFASTIGLQAVAASLLVIAPLQMLVALAFVRQALGLTMRELAAASRKSAVLTFGTGALPALVILLSPDGFALGIVETAIAVAGGAAGWLAAVILTGHPIRAEVIAVYAMLDGALHHWRSTRRRFAE